MTESKQPTSAEALDALDVLESVRQVAAAAIDEAGLQWPGATRNDVATVRRYIEQAGTDWQPIASAPKEAKDVQVYCADTREQFVAFWNGGQHWQFAQGPGGLSIVCQPTHWKPLGPPPEATDD